MPLKCCLQKTLQTKLSVVTMALLMFILTLVAASGRLNTNGIITCNTCGNIKNLNSVSPILINGHNSGHDSTIQSPTIECHGNQACVNAKITASYHNIYI